MRRFRTSSWGSRRGAVAALAACSILFGTCGPARADFNLDSQLKNMRDAEYKNRDAANRARNLGRNSMGRGARNMRMGHHHHHPPQVHLGAFQIAQGILGMLAALAADKMANKDDGNAGNLDEMTGGSSSGLQVADSGNGDGTGGDVSGQSSPPSVVGIGGSGASVGAAKFDMNDPEAKKALGLIQDQYGYTPEQFMAKLQGGVDPKAIFEGAPKNPLSTQEANVAWKASRSGEDSTLAMGGDDAAAKNTPYTPTPASADPAAATATPAKEGGGLRDELNRSLASDDDDMDVSPEVKSALEARDAEERARQAALRSHDELDLFEVVHQKYLEREKNLRWGGAMDSAVGGPGA